MQTLGERIKKHREDRGLNRKELAAKVGVSAANITNWEADNYIPGSSNLIALATELKVTPSYLLTGKKDHAGDTAQKLKSKVEEIVADSNEGELQDVLELLNLYTKKSHPEK